jgi:hypothetical protein
MYKTKLSNKLWRNPTYFLCPFRQSSSWFDIMVWSRCMLIDILYKMLYCITFLLSLEQLRKVSIITTLSVSIVLMIDQKLTDSSVNQRLTPFMKRTVIHRFQKI